MSYKIIKSSKGTRYMKNHRFVKKEDIPKFILDGHNPEGDCIVCQEPGKHHRVITGMTVALCDNDYFNRTYGYIAGIIKERGFNVHEDASQRSTT